VGLKKRLFPSLLLISSIPILHAAPTLRVTASALGPIPVSTGGTAPTQTLEAYNIGDGSMTLTMSSSVTWITPTVGASRACSTMNPPTPASACIPLQFALNTSSLAAGTYTGVVTITAPNTIDAPQTITITVRVGAVDVFMAPGATRDFQVSTMHPVNTRATTQDGSNWLSLSLEGTGSFRFIYPYNIHIAPVDGMNPGNYTGSVISSGSSVSGENFTIPVTMHLTTQPIAEASPNQVSLRLGQGAPPLVPPFSPLILVNNLGQGSLAVQSATASGGSWLKTGDFVPCMPLAPYCGYLSIDPSNLSPGDNSGTVTLTTNAANGTITIPVSLTVTAKGAPLIYYQGVLDNGTFVPGDTVAAGDVMVVKGEQLSFNPYTPGQAPPLINTLGGATITVNGVQAPFYYSSSGQLAFQMPYEIPAGMAQVQVQRDGQTSNIVTVNVAPRAPRIIAIVNPDSRCPAGTPPGLCVNTSDGAHPAQSGDVLTIYAIGLGPTSPSVATGAPAPIAEPLARVTDPSLVVFGTGPTAPTSQPFFIGLTPASSGLYQANVTIPDDSPKGLIPLRLGVADSVSNVVLIAVQ